MCNTLRVRPSIPPHPDPLFWLAMRDRCLPRLVWAITWLIVAVNLAKDLFFICWSRRRLLTRFRDDVMRDGPLVVPRAPPPLPSVLKPPLFASAPTP